MPNSERILALNAGSSSLKFGLFEAEGGRAPRPQLRGLIEGIGKTPHFTARNGAGETIEDRAWDASHASHADVLGGLLGWLEDGLDGEALACVGHRIVHGGRQFHAPVRLTPAIIDALEELTPLAPLHQPNSLRPIRSLARLRPDLPQIGCFDTAFHHNLAPPVSRFAVPRALEAEGVRRYGFHGLSYEFIAARLRDMSPDLSAGRTVVAHLGNGASLCAMQDGRSVDTTMGMTALDGLVMGTRPGALDPGVLLYLLQAKTMSVPELERFLYYECGLLGVSGLSADMRTLLASDDAHAAEAIELFVFRLSGAVATMANSLGGLDTLVFTGGIGEHSSEIRQKVCDRLAWLGAAIDPGANTSASTRLSPPESRVAVLVVPTDEEAVIAGHCLALQATDPSPCARA